MSFKNKFITAEAREAKFPLGNEGFTLIETLIAFVILALSLFALFQAIGQGSRNLAIAGQSETAMALARSKLVEMTGPGRLENATEQGAFDNGYTWTMTSTTPATRSSRGAVSGRWVSITVRWGGESVRAREKTLTTYVLGRAEP